MNDEKDKRVPAAIIYDPYEYCWQTGNYVDQDCEQCDHKWECSGYTDEDDGR